MIETKGTEHSSPEHKTHMGFYARAQTGKNPTFQWIGSEEMSRKHQDSAHDGVELSS